MQIMHRKTSAILNLEAWFSSENLRRLHQGKSLRSHGFSLLYSKRYQPRICIRDLKIECGARPLTRRGKEARGGGALPYVKGGDARREISNEPLKGTNLGVA